LDARRKKRHAQSAVRYNVRNVVGRHAKDIEASPDRHGSNVSSYLKRINEQAEEATFT
jgi:hypothetical protein